MIGLVFSILVMAAFAVIGVVWAPKAGRAKGRIWLGLVLLIVSAFLGLVWQAVLTLFVPSIYDSLGGAAGVGLVSGVTSIITSGLSIAGVAVIVSAVALNQQPTGYLDPTQPGTPPVGQYGGNPYA